MTRKMKIMLGILASAALVALAGTGLYLRFGLQVLDRPGMENPAGPMLELLNADWMSDDGVWSARIEGETLDLSYRQELVYSGGFSFDFQGDGLNAKTELSFDDKQFESEDGSVSSTMESLSVENRKLYLVITVSKAGEASVRQQMVLNRAESGKTTEGESEKIREVSDMAELMEFSWHQSAMSFSDCFDFQIKTAEGKPAAPRLYCDYTDTETGERIELGEESSGFQGFRLDGTRTDNTACPPVPLERWEELADFLRKAELSPYSPPEPGLMDATNSNIQVTWRENGEKFTNSYSGVYAHELLKLLQDIAGEVSRNAFEKPKPE